MSVAGPRPPSMRRMNTGASMLIGSLAFAVVAASSCAVPECMTECCSAASLTDTECPGGASVGRRFQEPRFQPGGDCWIDSESASRCTAECVAALDACEANDGG